MLIGLSKQRCIDKLISYALTQGTNDQTRETRVKYGFKETEKYTFHNWDISPSDMYQYLINGYAVSQPLKCYRKNGEYTLNDKINKNFVGTQWIAFDIDRIANSKTPEEYIQKLRLKPTFWYTTFGNKPDQPKFRMIYCFETYKDMSHIKYRYFSMNLWKYIQPDPREKIDPASFVGAQYMNGSNHTVSSFKGSFSGNTYWWSTIGGGDTEKYKDWLITKRAEYSESGFRENRDNINLEIGIEYFLLEEHPDLGLNKTMVEEYTKYQGNSKWGSHWRGFMLPRSTYDIPWTKDLIWQYTDEDPRQEFVRIPFKSEVKVAGGRHRTIRQNAQLYRLINPDAKPDQVFYMIAWENQRILESPFPLETLLMYVEKAFSMTLDEIKEENKIWIDRCTKDKPTFIMNPFIKYPSKERKILKMKEIQRHIIKERIEKTGLYNRLLSAKDNWLMMVRIDPRITLSQVKTYHTFRSRRKGKKLSLMHKPVEDWILSHYNPGITLKENTRILNDQMRSNYSESKIYSVIKDKIDFSSSLVKDKKKEERDKKKEDIIIESGLIDWNQSFRINMKRLRNNNIKVSQDILRNILKYKDRYSEGKTVYCTPSENENSRKVVVICEGLDRLF